MAFSSNAQDSDGTSETELTAKEKDLLSQYHGEVELPNSLLRAYWQFTEATEDATKDKLKGFTLPYAVSFTTVARGEANNEYGVDMNLPFLKTAFHKQIMNLRMESEYCFLLRTGTSYIRYIKTASGDWKIYNYGDKPIE